MTDIGNLDYFDRVHCYDCNKFLGEEGKVDQYLVRGDYNSWYECSNCYLGITGEYIFCYQTSGVLSMVSCFPAQGENNEVNAQGLAEDYPDVIYFFAEIS